MFYRCAACSQTVIVGAAAAWPEACPACRTAPFIARGPGLLGGNAHSGSRRVDVLEQEAPHLIDPADPRPATSTRDVGRG